MIRQCRAQCFQDALTVLAGGRCLMKLNGTTVSMQMNYRLYILQSESSFYTPRNRLSTFILAMRPQLLFSLVLALCLSAASSTSIPATAEVTDTAQLEDPLYHPLQDLEQPQSSSIEGLLKARSCPSGTGLCRTGGCCPIHGQCCNNGKHKESNFCVLFLTT